MTPGERRGHVHQVVSALEEEMVRETHGLKQAYDMVKAVKTVRQWARRDCGTPSLVRTYTRLAKQVRAYADRVEHFAVKTELLRYVLLLLSCTSWLRGDLTRGLLYQYREMRKLDLSAGNVDGESAQAKAERVLAAVKHLPQTCSAEDVGAWILKLDEVIYHPEKDWKPRTNPVVCECYQQ